MKTVEKAMDILNVLTVSHKKLNLTAIAEAANINKSSTYKILQVLCSYGYVEKLDGGAYYRLGSSIVNSLFHIAKSSALPAIAHPILEQLHQDTGRTINLMAYIGNSGVYLDIVSQENSQNLIGSTDYLHATALGKAIMAFLPDEELTALLATITLKQVCKNTICDPEQLRNELILTRKRGFAIDDEEDHVGSRCVAAPLLTADGTVVGAISVSGVAASVAVSTLFAYSAYVLDAAKRISALL